MTWAAPSSAVSTAVPRLLISIIAEPYPELPGGYAPYSDLGTVYGTGAILGLSFECRGQGFDCDTRRPVELRQMQGGKTTIVTSGTILGLAYKFKTWDTYQDIQRMFPLVDTSAPAKLGYQWVLPAWNGLTEVTSSVREFEIRRATKLRISVVHGAWDPEGYGPGIFHYCIRRDGSQVPVVTLRISPTAPAREGFYEYVENGQVVAKRLVSTRRGVFRFPGPKDRSDARIIRVPATANLAGFSVTFDPCS